MADDSVLASRVLAEEGRSGNEAASANSVSKQQGEAPQVSSVSSEEASGDSWSLASLLAAEASR